MRYKSKICEINKWNNIKIWLKPDKRHRLAHEDGNKKKRGFVEGGKTTHIHNTAEAVGSIHVPISNIKFSVWCVGERKVSHIQRMDETVVFSTLHGTVEVIRLNAWFDWKKKEGKPHRHSMSGSLKKHPKSPIYWSPTIWTIHLEHHHVNHINFYITVTR